MNKIKKIPAFKSEDEERKFWDTHDSTEYVDWSRAEETVFPNLQPSTQTISLRLPESLLARIKNEANKKDIPYQSLMKIYLSKAVEEDQSLPLASYGIIRDKAKKGR